MSAVRKSPLDLDAWEQLNEVCRNLDRPDEAKALYAEALAGELATEPLAGEALEHVGRLAADFCEEWYEDTAPVLNMLGRVLGLEPGQKWAFDRMTLLLTAAARWDDLLGAYDVALAVASDAQKKQSLYEEAAKIARDFAAQPGRASDYLKELLLLRLSDEQLAATVERRFDEQQRHQDLIEIWTARLTVLDKPTILRTRLQIAERYFEHLKDSKSALLAIDAFLSAGGAEALAVQVLERVANTSQGDVGAQRDALARLDHLHAAAGRSAEVISVAERALSLAQTDEERVALHRKALSLYSKSNQLERALEHCADLLKIDAMAEDVRRQARSIAEEIGRLDLFAVALVHAADLTQHAERRVEFLVEAGDVRATLLGDAAGAIELYFRVEGDKASSDELKLLSCQKLDPLLQAAARHSELLSVLERWSALPIKESLKREILARAGHLALSLEQPERALGLWEKVLQVDAEDDEALSLRVQILGDLARYSDLVLSLRARSEVGSEDRRKRDDLIRAAVTYAEQLRDLSEAIVVWHVIEDRFGRDDQTVDALCALMQRAERHEDVASLLNEAIAQELDADRVVEQLALLGDTLRVHLEKEKDALVAYGRALKIKPEHPGAREGTSALLTHQDLAHEAGETLAQAYRIAQDHALIIDLAELRIKKAPSLAFKAEVLLEVARLHEQAEQPSAALQALRRAFALVPSASIEREVHRLAEITQDWSVVEQAYAEAIAGCEVSDRVASLYLVKGQVEEERLSNAAAATASYVQALARDAAQLPVALALVRAAHHAHLFGDAAWAIIENSRISDEVPAQLLTAFASCTDEHGDWDRALEGMADKIASAGTMSARVAHDIKKQLAVWYRDRVSDPDSAELVLKRAVADYREVESLRMLADLQRRAPGRPLVATLCTLAEISGDDLTVLREAAAVALQAVGDAELATPILKQALAGASAEFSQVGAVHGAPLAAEVCSWATDQLVELALAAREFMQGVVLLQAASALPFPDDQQIALLYRAAQVAEAGALDEAAVDICESILAREPYHEGTITLLSALHEKSERLDDLLTLRKRELLLDRPLERRLFLRLDQARVIGVLGGALDERLKVLRENLIDRPGHEQTIEALAEILTTAARFAELVDVFEQQADALSAQATERSARLWERAGTLAFAELGDEARLVFAYKKAAAAKPNIVVVDALAKIAREHQQDEEAVSWLSLRLSLTPEVAASADGPSDRRTVVVLLGRALVKTDEWNTASSMLETELAKDPGADAARQLLAEIYRELNAWEALCHLLETGVDYAPDDKSKITYLREAAVVHRKQLGQVEAAIPLLEAAIALDYADRSLRLMLADTLRVCSHNEEARGLLHGLLEEFGRRRTRERAMVHMQLAKIAEATGNLDEAIEQADAAANIERSDAAILMLVGQLARQKGALDRAEQAYRTLALISGRRSSQAGEGSVDEVGESTVLFELYRIALEKADHLQARELLESAIDVATRDQDEALRLSKALADSGQLGLLVNALQAGIESGLKGEAAARILITKANVLEQGDRSEEAFVSRLQAMTETPSDLRLLDATQKLAERLDLTEDLWAHVTFLAEQNAGQPNVAGELWYRAGQAAQSKDELGRAAELFELAQKTEYKPRRTFQALDQVLDEGRAPERVRQALRVFVSTPGADTNSSVFADALYRLADMELVHSQLDEATQLLERALDLEPQPERVVSMLESHVREGSVGKRTLELFVNVARRAASEELLLLAYLKAVAADDATPTLVAEAIALARRMDNAQALRELLSRAIELARGDRVLVADIMVERAKMARDDGDFAFEADLIRSAIPCFAEEAAFELKLRLATCLADDQNDAAQALQIFEELFRSAPVDGRVWRPLLSIYRTLGATQRVEEVIDLISDDVTDEADLEALKLERVRLIMRDGRDDEAESELRAVLLAHPQMAEAASLLVKILRAQERWDELRALLSDLLDQARTRHDARLVAQCGMELSRLVETGDRQEAINILLADLKLTRGSRELLTYLLSLYQEDDNQSERADVMEHMIAVSAADEARQLTLGLVQVRADLGDQFGVGRALELGVKAAPHDVELAEALLTHLRATQEHGALADALMMRAGQLSGERAAQRYAEAGQIYDEFLGEPRKAASAYEAAYKADATVITYLEKAVLLAVNVGDVDAALAKLSVALETAQEFMLADLLQLRASVIAREKMMDRSAMMQASSDLARALQQFIPEDQEYQLQQSRIQVLTDLRALHQAEGDLVGEREVVKDLSDLFLTTKEAAASLDVLASWLRDHDDDVDVADELGRRALQVGDPPMAVFAYQKLAEASQGAQKIRAVLALSDAAFEANDPSAARLALEDALALEPQNHEVLRRLRAMYEASGAFGELAGILQSEADRQEDPVARFALLIQVGDLHLHSGDSEAASTSFSSAQALGVNGSVAVARLAQVYLSTGESERARELLDEAIKEHGKRRSPELALLQHGLAQVEEAAGNLDGVFLWLEAALISDRNNAEIASELAVRAQEVGRFDVAIKALQNLTLSKAEGGMSKAEAYLRQAQIAVVQGDEKKALLMGRRAQSADAELPGVAELLAQVGG